MVAGKIPWTEEPCGLQSTGLQRVGHSLAIEHTGNRGEITKWVADEGTGSMGQKVQRRWPQQQEGPQREGRGGQGGGHGEALGQDADLEECDLADCCSFETKWVRSSSRKRDDHRDGEMG